MLGKDEEGGVRRLQEGKVEGKVVVVGIFGKCALIFTVCIDRV